MYAKIFGPSQKKQVPTVLLLHGGGLCWWNYRSVAEKLADRYRVVLPILDGHGENPIPFTTIEAAATHILEEIDATWGGHVALLGGVSLGAQVTLSLLAQRPDVCDAALVESALTIPMPLTRQLVGPVCAISAPLIRKRWFAKAQFHALHLPPALFEEYARDSCRLSQDSLTALLEANASFSPPVQLAACTARTLVTVGSRERPVMRRSARQLADLLPNARLKILPGYRHGAFSAWHAAEYGEAVEALLRPPVG